MSTNPVIIDPKELRDFITQLKRFNLDLESSTSRLKASIRRLGETWRDPAFSKFEQEFDQTIRNIYRFRSVSEETIKILTHKAEKAEDVHSG